MAFIYTLCFVIISYIIIAGKYAYHRTGWIGFLRRNFIKAVCLTGSVFEKFIPASITRGFTSIVTYVLFTRNPCIQLLYGFLLTGGTAIYTLKVIPYFDKINAFCIIVYILVAINVSLFWVCSTRDAGIISASLHSVYVNDYDPDGIYYTAQECYTCKFVRPARSKHCSICNVCVSRFDHHCSRVNNCIGKKNYKFFLGFISSTAVLCAYTTFVVTVVFVYIVMSDGLGTMTYVDSHGKQHPVDIRILTQYLLVQYPLMAILFLTVLLFGVAMTGFSLFHCYLTLTNQTTNEFSKRIFSIKNNGKMSRPTKMTAGPRKQVTTLRPSKRKTGNNRKVSSTISSETSEVLNVPQQTITPYDKGVWRNIMEVVRC